MRGETTPAAPEGRSTTFQAVQGEPEHYSGATLLVTAYAALWVVLFVWVASAWRRQRAIDVRLGELEKIIADGGASGSTKTARKQGADESPHAEARREQASG